MNATAAVISCSPRQFAMIEHFALQGLRYELACYPKPGLVSFVDSGSHADMTATTFLRSIDALRGYFASMAAAGADSASFAELNALGRAAEQRMLAATDGRNTHRGAIFTMGLLAVGAGCCAVYGEYRAERICKAVRRHWGKEILAMERVPQPISHGLAVRKLYGVTGAREEAAAGFPTIRHASLPEYRRMCRAGASRNACAVQVLFAIIAMLPDNNLLYRGGLSGLAFAQAQARAFLDIGGMLTSGGGKKAVDVHLNFVDANLSPGGAADLLAATAFLSAWEQWGRHK
jgi:triphosphoribosyl-dephospho-CoA synthase